MPGCCLPAGYVPPAKMAALALLRQLGVDLPDGAQVWGPRDGLMWRVVDRYGRDPGDGPLGSTHRLTALQGLEASQVEIEVHPTRGRLLRVRD